MRKAIFSALILGAVCCVVLLFSANGFVQTLLAVAPEWLVAVMTIAAALVSVFTIVDFARWVKSR
jgi:mannose/fructose/N-acetylgalactosamine-specific phosphotransferase system component IIC